MTSKGGQFRRRGKLGAVVLPEATAKPEKEKHQPSSGRFNVAIKEALTDIRKTLVLETFKGRRGGNGEMEIWRKRGLGVTAGGSSDHSRKSFRTFYPTKTQGEGKGFGTEGGAQRKQGGDESPECSIYSFTRGRISTHKISNREILTRVISLENFSLISKNCAALIRCSTCHQISKE